MMHQAIGTDAPLTVSLEVFHPRADILYSLEAAAQLAGVARRTILVYCRAGLVHPVVQPPYGIMEFTEEAIFAVRRIQHLRTVHGLALPWIKQMLDLMGEVERLRAEVRFLRGS
jgi:DNA-binding transcriptional MerR regulator